MDYSKALFNLNPILRRRLRAVAHIADMTEMEALRTIVETSPEYLESSSTAPPTEDRG